MDIAIVGMDCRFPGAPDTGRLWSLVLAGASGLAGSPNRQPTAPANHDSYVAVSGALDDIDCFDEAFFGYTPREAALLDPQQRVFLESCWRALEDAGQPPSQSGRVGVFAGAGPPTYLLNNVMPALHAGDENDNFLAYTANDKDFLATRVAFKLDLQGPAITVQTACSTGLVAVHLACQSLQLAECDLALAGGVTIRVPQRDGYIATADGIESPEGCCRPFDAAASGTVFANGAGVVVLKAAEAALADGDRIYAVIKGTAVNNDGAGKASFTAPSAAGQAAVIMEALAVADADPASIAFVETHGTGTSLGDAVELAGLQQVFATCPPSSCGLGAVKANIGHTDVAAGIAGLITAALSLHHRILPPLANWRKAAPDSPLGAGPLFAATEARPLDPPDGVIRAGVSAFGVGGTNAHVVLEAAPARALPVGDDRPQLLVWSARGAAARTRLTGLLGAQVAKGGAIADIAWSLQTSRTSLPERAALATRDANDAVAGLSAPKRIRTGSVTGRRPRLAFMFPGQGAQFPGMGEVLYRQEPVFATTIDAAAARLANGLGFDLRQVLFPSAAETERARVRLRETSVTQPAVFAVSVAIRRVLADWGLLPDVVIGHSLGEYAAMVAAGVLGFEPALDLVAARGRLMQAMPGGRMAAVLAAEADIRLHLAPGTEITAINSPTDCVVGGPADAVAATLSALDRAGIVTRPLETSHAFHSAMIEPMLPEFARLAAACDRSAPRIPLISNLTAQPLADAAAGYFTAQIRQPVRFGDGIAALRAGGPVVALEVGPGTVLGGLARRQGLRAFATMPPGGDRQALLDAVGALWCEGFEPDWRNLHRTPRLRVELPPYPFAPIRHWIEPAPRGAPPRPAVADLDIRFAGWRRHHPTATALPVGNWAVIGACPAPLVRRLRSLGARAGAGLDAEPCDGLVISGIAAADLPPVLARAIDGGRLRQCLFLLPGLADIQGTETLTVNAARLAGLALALARERPEIAVRIVDPGDLDPAAALPSLLSAPMPLSAWRGRSSWVPEFPAVTWPAAAETARGGACLVIGATGRIGRIAAAALRAARPEATLYLASRGGGGVPGIAGETRIVDLDNLRPLIDEILTRHDRLDGVVFAAGSLAADTFAGVTEPLPAAYDRVKVEGLAALATALDSVPCGFVVVCGSLSAWLGGVGYGAYAGANLAAAGIARNAGRRGGTNWITLSLDAVARGSLPVRGLAEIPESRLADLFARLFRAAPALGSVEVIAAADLDSRWSEFAASIGGGAAIAEASSPLAAGADPVAAAWCAVLGTEWAEEADNFFAAGGSSVQALQLLARLRREAGLELSLAGFFEAPTLAALRLRLGTAPKAAAATVRHIGPAPLSAGQLGLWLAEQRAETAGRFNIVELYRLEGPLDIPAVRSALAGLEARHDGLRTRFVERDALPLQVVDPPGRARLFEERVAAGDIEARLAREVRRRVDLSSEPAWRMTLLDAWAGGRFLLLAAHHILLDDWSIGLFFAEFADAYDRAVAGLPNPPPPPSPGFAAFCRAQAEALAAGAYDRLLAAWQDRLADAPRRVPLAPPAVPDRDGAVRLHLDGARVRDLGRLGERTGASLFSVLLAIYKTSLAAETGSLDISVGIPLAGRPAGEWDRVLGYFVNPAAIWTDLAAAPDFAALVAAVKTGVLEACALEQVPYERVAARLGAGSSGLFNVWFTILTHAAPRPMAGGLRLVPTRLGPRPSRFELALVLEPEGDGLTGWLEYQGERVGKAAAERIAAHIESLIGQVTTAPDCPLATLLGRREDRRVSDSAAAPLSLAGRMRRRGGTAGPAGREPWI